MTAMAIPIPALPDSAPFTPAQRAWLNGFLAGLLNGWPPSAAPAVAPAPVAERAALDQAARQAEEEQFPWHDPALEMAERLKLAEGKPHDRVLMAAVAQLDCGACGYLCQSYAEAIARGEEKDLTKCAPGGRETARKLKELVTLNRAGPATVAAVATPPAARPASSLAPTVPTQPAHNRHNPFPAPLLECALLNKSGSTKDTRLVRFDLAGSGISYEVGDSLGVYPENCPDTVQWLLEALDVSGVEEVPLPDDDGRGARIPLGDALLRHYAVTRPGAELLELLAASATDPADAGALRAMLADDGPGVPDGHEVIDVLHRFPSARPPLQPFLAALSPLQPRLYSISSSPRACPGEVHLTVGVVRYLNDRGRQCKGVASTFLGERARPGQKVRVFIQPSHGFRLPRDGDTPIIMVGPGTGVAPFRAFLQERRAAGARGRNWLFFGDQRRDFDFLYEQELSAWRQEGLLTRLDTAFSRDQHDKLYVQHRMLENGAAIWSWLKEGAFFYVCGDARRMARDVDAALTEIAGAQGGLAAAAAKAFVAELFGSGRYRRDVY